MDHGGRAQRLRLHVCEGRRAGELRRMLHGPNATHTRVCAPARLPAQPVACGGPTWARGRVWVQLVPSTTHAPCHGMACGMPIPTRHTNASTQSTYLPKRSLHCCCQYPPTHPHAPGCGEGCRCTCVLGHPVECGTRMDTTKLSTSISRSAMWDQAGRGSMPAPAPQAGQPHFIYLLLAGWLVGRVAPLRPDRHTPAPGLAHSSLIFAVVCPFRRSACPLAQQRRTPYLLLSALLTESLLVSCDTVCRSQQANAGLGLGRVALPAPPLDWAACNACNAGLSCGPGVCRHSRRSLEAPRHGMPIDVAKGPVWVAPTSMCALPQKHLPFCHKWELDVVWLLAGLLRRGMLHAWCPCARSMVITHARAIALKEGNDAIAVFLHWRGCRGAPGPGVRPVAATACVWCVRGCAWHRPGTAAGVSGRR